MEEARVGVVGYCPPTQFDEHQAKRLIVEAFDEVACRFAHHSITIVSGHADLGIPALAYAEAVRRGWRTAGVVCRRRANKYPLFPVDDSRIIEDESQESATFLRGLAMLLRFGGGRQSHEEVAAAQQTGTPTLEYELDTL